MSKLIHKAIDSLLKETSRSFYLTLKALPPRIRPQIGLGYLLARIADTIADAKGGPTDQRLRLLELIETSGASEVVEAEDDEERARIWKGRKSAFSAAGRLSPDFLVQDGVVPRGRLGEALRKMEELGASHGLRVANVFHAGDGNLHPLILYDGRVEGELERAEELAGEILRLCVGLGAVSYTHLTLPTKA